MGCGANYPNYAYSVLVYGPFSLSDAIDADLLFYRWSKTELDYDELFWGASLDGNSYYGSAVSGDWSAWKSQEFDLTNVYTLGNLCGQPAVWIGFFFVSDVSITYPEGVYLDSIVLRKLVGGSSRESETTIPLPEPETISDGNRTLRPAVFHLTR